jgi:hypothetical protein
MDIVTSTESVAAFAGALSAFALAATGKWLANRRVEWMAGNEAIFAIAQMYSLIVGLKRQQFDEQIDRFTREKGREPNYTEFLPVEGGAGDVLRPKLDALGFLLQSHDPDLLNRLAIVVQKFDVMMNAMRELSVTQNQFQQALEARLPNLPGGITLPALEDNIGPYIMTRLMMMVEATRTGLPDCATDLEEIGKQLSDTISYSFPLWRVSKFEAIERERPTEVPSTAGKPRVWRRVVRFFSRIGRKKIF